jgi:hypothetical protein
LVTNAAQYSPATGWNSSERYPKSETIRTARNGVLNPAAAKALSMSSDEMP